MTFEPLMGRSKYTPPPLVRPSLAELSTRAYNALLRYNVSPDATPREIERLLPILRAGVQGNRGGVRVRNLGRRTIEELELWVRTYLDAEFDGLGGA